MQNKYCNEKNISYLLPFKINIFSRYFLLCTISFEYTRYKVIYFFIFDQYLCLHQSNAQPMFNKMQRDINFAIKFVISKDNKQKNIEMELGFHRYGFVYISVV